MSDGEHEDYYTQCAELYLTVNGNVVFHCTLCEEITKRFDKFKDHLSIHFQKFIAEQNKSDEDLCDEDLSNIDEYLEVLEPAGDLTEQENKLIENSEDTSCQSEVVRNIYTGSRCRESNRERRYKCDICNFSCTEKGNLRQHRKRHFLEKPHKCTQCPKAFYSTTELNIHIRTHTGEKPFLCTTCGISFTTSSRLCAHRKRHANIKDKICPVCNAAFYETALLNKHLVIHSDERRHKCSQCGAAFKQPTGLRTHMKIHKNKKEYACTLCEAKFNQQAGLYSHMKTTHTLCLNNIERDSESALANLFDFAKK